MRDRGVLFWKKRAEEALQRSGLDYTIVRPGAHDGSGLCCSPSQPLNFMVRVRLST